MASGSAISSLVGSLSTGFQDVAGDAVSAIGSIVPYALPVLGAIVVIGIAIKVFKKVTGTKNS